MNISKSNQQPYQYKSSDEQVMALKQRMRNGTGASRLLQAENAPTHYLDALERFRKDYASYDKQQRDVEKQKRQYELERKRLEQLQRENKRWQVVEQYHDKLKTRQDVNSYNIRMGVRRNANSSSLAYNPINLNYDTNPEGERLKYRDEDAQIRRFVRAKNMQDRGNSKYNPINGQIREGIRKVVPEQLNERYAHKLENHYDNIRLKAPSLNLSNSVANHDQSNVRYTPRYY